MPQYEGVPTSEADLPMETVRQPEINFDGQVAEVSYPNLNLTEHNPTSPEVTVTIEKQPTKIVEGETYCNGAVLVDTESESMRSLATQEEALKELPEAQRPGAVLKLLRENVHYAYNDVIDAIAQTNPDLAAWVAKNTGVDSHVFKLPLSQIIDKGYGVCRHLSVAYLWLAQKAGLEGTLLTSDYRGITNVERRDNGKQLFKSVAVGEPLIPHAWTEVRLSNGEWVPVDPSVMLVGDTEEGMQTFQEAGYNANLSMGDRFRSYPKRCTHSKKIYTDY
ncbi:MAG: transglutaminase-like domain-containing protein [Patescibacteria group bacterium]